MAIGEGLEDRKKRFSELWDEALARGKKIGKRLQFGGLR